LKTVLGEFLPKRLAQRLCEIELGSRPLRQYSPRDLRAICERLQNWRFRPRETEGYRTAEVTLGGVDTDELSSATMESKIVPGLYFIGEVVDVTGHLGGFNFQWAWSSGWAAGQVV
jgi:predicted Rossmann fold flavoprotein